MSRLLLDTTLLVDVERSGDALSGAFSVEDDVAISAITVAELRLGASLVVGRGREASMAYVDDVVAGIPVLSYDAQVAETHARLLVASREQGRPRGAHDLIIAATAAASDRTIVTADAGAYEDLPGVRFRSH